MRPLTLSLVLLAACPEGAVQTSPAEKPEAAPPEPAEPKPVYTSAVCCVTGRTCELDGARPLGATCACPDPGSALQGHVC